MTHAQPRRLTYMIGCAASADFMMFSHVVQQMTLAEARLAESWLVRRPHFLTEGRSGLLLQCDGSFTRMMAMAGGAE